MTTPGWSDSTRTTLASGASPPSDAVALGQCLGERLRDVEILERADGARGGREPCVAVTGQNDDEQWRFGHGRHPTDRVPPPGAPGRRSGRLCADPLGPRSTTRAANRAGGGPKARRAERITPRPSAALPDGADAGADPERQRPSRDQRALPGAEPGDEQLGDPRVEGLRGVLGAGACRAPAPSAWPRSRRRPAPPRPRRRAARSAPAPAAPAGRRSDTSWISASASTYIAVVETKAAISAAPVATEARGPDTGQRRRTAGGRSGADHGRQVAPLELSRPTRPATRPACGGGRGRGRRHDRPLDRQGPVEGGVEACLDRSRHRERHRPPLRARTVRGIITYPSGTMGRCARCSRTHAEPRSTSTSTMPTQWLEPGGIRANMVAQRRRGRRDRRPLGRAADTGRQPGVRRATRSRRRRPRRVGDRRRRELRPGRTRPAVARAAGACARNCPIAVLTRSLRIDTAGRGCSPTAVRSW